MSLILDRILNILPRKEDLSLLLWPFYCYNVDLCILTMYRGVVRKKYVL